MNRYLTLGAIIDADLDLDGYVSLARTLERARFATLLVGATERFEPLTLLAALSTVVKDIGLVGTIDQAPYHVARKVATLDHLSHGRAGWHIGASTGNRTDELVDVVRQLWDSFSDKAILRDVESARYYDPDQLRTPHHRGEHFTVRGPLNISRPPQGHPVLFSTGAAPYADVVLTTQPDLPSAQEFYADVKARADGVLVWPVVSSLDGDTPEQLADRLALWFTERGADGFAVSFRGSATEFVEHVLPILRHRGLVRDEYVSATLRENLGLPRPEVLR